VWHSVASRKNTRVDRSRPRLRMVFESVLLVAKCQLLIALSGPAVPAHMTGLSVVENSHDPPSQSIPVILGKVRSRAAGESAEKDPEDPSLTMPHQGTDRIFL